MHFIIYLVREISFHENDSFVERLTANYSEDGSNDKLVEVNVCKIFVDFVESSFMDGKVILNGFIYL